MKFENRLKITALVGAIFFVTTSCSHGPAVQDFPPTASASEELIRFESALDVATQKQVNVLSPDHFNDADEARKDSRASLERQKDPKDTLHRIAQGQVHLKLANGVAQMAQANIEDVISARNAAVNASGPRFFPSDFKKTDDFLKGVTRDLENGNPSSAATHRKELQSQYLSLELRAIKHSNLGIAQEMVTLAKREGATEFAPRTLAIAEKSILDTDAFITANRHDTANVAARAKLTASSAEQLLKITRDSKAGKKVSSEDNALNIDRDQKKLADTETQLTEQRMELADSQGDLKTEKGNNRDLSAENRVLEADQVFNETFDLAQKQFTRDEAEVYKQGNTLVIRLRGLKFPTSQAVIQGSNFPLLAKVGRVIRVFGKSSVVIEGHTDSLGDRAKNELLSSERAEAVKKYLVSNDLGEIDIKSVGFGYQRPIATNKSAQGRAQNRRVDVRIQPIKAASL